MFCLFGLNVVWKQVTISSHLDSLIYHRLIWSTSRILKKGRVIRRLVWFREFCFIRTEHAGIATDQAQWGLLQFSAIWVLLRGDNREVFWIYLDFFILIFTPWKIWTVLLSSANWQKWIFERILCASDEGNCSTIFSHASLLFILFEDYFVIMLKDHLLLITR